MTKIESTLIAVIAFFIASGLVGADIVMHSIYKDCHEFGGAKLMSGVVIECKAEILK